MIDFLRELVATDGFHPHGYCYLWRPGLIWLHVISDTLIGLAYVGIGFGLAQFVRRGRGQLPFSRMFVAFGVFIAACGATHFVEVWTLWTPVYWLAGSVKLVTAAASVFTALALPPLIPVALGTLASARVSEQRRSDLEAANRRLTELDELKTQFFANVSHELRTPLTLIMGPIEQMLRDAELPPEHRHRLATAQRNADLLLRHVNDLLDVAKLQAGRMELSYRRTDLPRLVRQSAAHFESAAASRGISFEVETPDLLPGEVDPDQVERVLFNLLGNAIKFTPQGGRIRCALEGVTEDEELAAVRILVHDSGPGVPVPQRQAVFEPFRQAEGGADRRYGGTGLGLAIVADLVALHGGSVHVDDSLLGGAAFVVRLPIRAPEGTPVGQGEWIGAPLQPPLPPRDEAGGVEPERDEAPGEDRPLVLVVEDNPDLNAFVAETLADLYRVVRVFDGREGIERARAQVPDLIISDLMMPEVTGAMLVRELRRDPALDATPILLLSARADEETRVGLLSEGAQDYLTKPFSTEELRARVANWMEMKRARDVLRRALDTTQGDVDALAVQIAARNEELEIALDAARRAYEAEEAAGRAKSDFVSVMSHELRTPLNGIFGYLDLLEAEVGGSLTEAQSRYVERAKRSADVLRGLVEEILTFARIEAGAVKLDVESVNLESLAREVATMLAPEAAAKGLALEVRPPREPLRVRTDAARLRQVLLNLTGNAVKFTESGVVSLRVEADGEGAVLRVEDTGPGIAAEHRERVFEPFWQVDASKTRRAGGTGLGLAIARSLVELLGGRLELESEQGVGTRFTVRLPAAAPDDGAAPR